MYVTVDDVAFDVCAEEASRFFVVCCYYPEERAREGYRHWIHHSIRNQYCNVTTHPAAQLSTEIHLKTIFFAVTLFRS